MASPQKKLLLELRQKSAMREDYKPLGVLPKGVKFPIKQFSVRICKQFDSAGQVVMNPEMPLFTLCVDYKIGSLNYYTYLPTDFQSTNKEELEKKAKTFNEGMIAEPLSLVYYGKAGGTQVLDLLGHGEDIDPGKLTGTKPNDKPEGSPKKKPKVD